MKRYKVREGSVAAWFVKNNENIKEWTFIIFMIWFLFLGIPTLVWIGEVLADKALGLF